MGRSAYKDSQNKYYLDLTGKNSLQDKLAGIINDYYGISFAYIHGSFVTEEYFADIDIAIFLSNEVFVSKEHALRQEIEIEMSLQKEVGYPVDVPIINSAPLSFCYNVLKNGKMLCSRDEELRVNFVTRTIDNYIDFLPHRKRYLKEVLGLEV